MAKLSPPEDGAGRASGDGAAVPVLAFLAITLFALSPVTTRIVTREIDPLMAGLLRTVGAMAVTLPLALLLRLPLPRTKRAWRLLALSAAGSFIAFPVLFCLGGERTSATHAALILAAQPLFTGLVASLVERRRPGRAWWLGAAMAFLGEAALVLLRSPGGTGGASVAGDLLVLAASLGSGIGYVAGSRLAAAIGSWSATFWSINLASLAQAPFVALLWRSTDWSALDPAGWSSLFHLTYGATVIALVCWFWALARGGIARVAVLQFAQPVIGLGLAALLLGEAITPPLLLAAAAILLGIALARRGSRPPPD